MTTLPEQAATAARAAALRLAPEYGPSLPTDVEAAIYRTDGPLTRYLDPVSIGALIVAVASFAWTVYRDLRKSTPEPSRDTVARTVRVQIRDAGPASPQRDRVIDVVVDETIRAAELPAPEIEAS
jgi:hypothetical protein